MLTLYRAVAYQLQAASTPPADRQPEVAVFFEASDAAAAPATLLRLLALAWGCEPAQVEFYNLFCEAELLADSTCSPSAGDARLLENGNANGPLFCRRLHTLMLVRPLTLMRLQLARDGAARLQAQRLAANGVRSAALPTANRAQVDQRAEYEAISAFGGF